MDNKYLDKVVEQMVSEIRMDHEENILYTPYRVYQITPLLKRINSFHSPYSTTTFYGHCISVYGLNEEESEYVWNEYREIVKDKING